MDALESAWLDERVLAADDVFVVDKPVHIPVHGGGAVVGSVTARLAEYLERDGETAPRLGVHQRLDQETSGVLLFTRSSELDPLVSRAFAERSLSRVYCAIVEGKSLPDTGTLECRLGPLHKGRVRAVRTGGKQARTQFAVRGRHGSRALVELRPETGRTHQLRVQLADAGTPILGDKLYGGGTAHRLMLHAECLEILGRRFEAAAPPEFDLALRGDAAELSTAAPLPGPVRDALCLRQPLLSTCSALRLLSGWGDGLSGIDADYFAGWVVLALGSEAAESRRRELVDLFMQLGARGVYVKCRRRTDPRRVDPEELAPSRPDAGEEAPAPLWVREGALHLPVWLGDGLSTGLFLDQRDNRETLRQCVRDKAVLNLFCYTGSFSAAAALGGAKRVTSVDLSGRALERAKLSVTENAPSATCNFIKEDVFEYLGRAKRRGERFDVVILDPPSFGTRGRRSTFNVAEHYEQLARQSLELMTRGGQLLAVTNHRKTSMQRLRRTLHAAARGANRHTSQMKEATSAADFPHGQYGPEPSKSVWIRLE